MAALCPSHVGLVTEVRCDLVRCRTSEPSAPLPLRTFVWRVVAVHMIAYFIAGLAALASMDYERQFSSGLMDQLMRPLDSPLIALGPILQVVNGLALAVMLAPFRQVFLGRGWRGATSLFVLLVGFSLFAPQTPGPGNLEGLLYTRIPLAIHALGLPEVFLHATLFTAALVGWCAQERRWMQRVAIPLIVLIVLASGLGVLDALGLLPDASARRS